MSGVQEKKGTKTNQSKYKNPVNETLIRSPSHSASINMNKKSPRSNKLKEKSLPKKGASNQQITGSGKKLGVYRMPNTRKS